MRQEQIKAIQSLEPLTRDELANVREHIAVLIAFGGKAVNGALTASNHDDWILMAIVDYTRKHGGQIVSVADVMKTAQYAKFEKTLPKIHEYIGAVSKEHLKQSAFVNLGIELLAADLAGMRIPVSVNALLRHMPNLPGVIERQFPGYFSNRLLGLIIRGEKKRVRKKQCDVPVPRSGGQPKDQRPVLHHTGRGARRGPPRDIP